MIDIKTWLENNRKIIKIVSLSVISLMGCSAVERTFL